MNTELEMTRMRLQRKVKELEEQIAERERAESELKRARKNGSPSLKTFRAEALS